VLYSSAKVGGGGSNAKNGRGPGYLNWATTKENVII
jgi:hypothetical protein